MESVFQNVGIIMSMGLSIQARCTASEIAIMYVTSLHDIARLRRGRCIETVFTGTAFGDHLSVCNGPADLAIRGIHMEGGIRYT